ncbi:Nucleic acid-binding, OB-fold [Phytophthora cinnamomi]|uniref:Nucleic acid-binding, OB-fold n=1 Tax=Phytophthora cinnamomi TaxID=4785 RepID=UPI00355A1501|nr:Nucleic acid-binding, OB-fold [Phytophthora cinnamomi]
MSAKRSGGGGSTAKAFVGQVYAALQASSRSTPSIKGVDCARLWVQGVVVATSEDRKQCSVDDGTGVLRLELKLFLKNAPPDVDARPQLGDYIMAIGPMQKAKADAAGSVRTLLAHQVVKLDAKLQREPMWFLEVVEYWTSVASTATT